MVNTVNASSSVHARHGRRAATTFLALIALLVAVPPAAANASPTRADVVVGLTTDPAEIGPAGGQVRLAVSVSNPGGAEAEDTTMKIELPDGATLSFGDLLDGWSCDAAKLKCRYGTLAAGTRTDFVLGVTLPPGEHDQTATIRAIATTLTNESSTTNNTSAATVRYYAQPDLAFSFDPEVAEISHLGGMGSRALIQARAVNIGTVAAPGLRFTFQPPAGAWIDTATFNSDGWDCDFSTSTWVCSDDREIAPDSGNYLNLDVRFPAGTVGDTRTLTGSASTAATERSLANNTGTAQVRYVVPPPGDVELYGLSVVGRDEVRANEEFEVAISLWTNGGSPSENVAVRVPLPVTVEPTSLDPGDPNWTCRFNQEPDNRFVECNRPFYDIATDPSQLRLKLKARPGTPDGQLTFTATASASTPESTLDNNTASDEVTYVAEGRVTGQVWIDLDRDGQRDADEPKAVEKIASVEFVSETGSTPWDQRYADKNDFGGYYYKRIKPGRYTVVAHLPSGSTIQFTTPDVGEDATDSDIITSISDYWDPRGMSAVVEVPDGGETAVDIGLLPQP